MSKQLTKSDLVNVLKENYKNLEQSILKQLLLETPNHHSTSGTHREKVWESLFRQIIPQKFSIAQGVFIIDSSQDTQVSPEVDLVIYDEQYTPYIFNYGNIKFIPIEAVSVVIQCKSKNVKNKADTTILKDWVTRLEKLNTNAESIARIATGIATSSVPTQKGTRPIKILCALDKCSDKENKPKFGFDISMYPKESNKGSKDYQLCIDYSDEVKNLYSAYNRFNNKGKELLSEEALKKEKELNTLNNKSIDDLEVTDNAILSLIFQLNQLLMLINNPMLFPHQAYVNMFNNSTEK
ncbi:hypothetical protein HMPREF9713_00442 [Myroides odoratimimus CCUG 12700]|uniref:DUF6602 domain-containing protein n=1 Tax=Myroides odoratimimus TaxID=76832 RepID=UPI0003539EE8|nr:DUF6602 domain-containing protein [Myroides odoratimimus]EPH13659.1 hypothetical protein HMPREF9713_00442 [Myroides odoratimimus CCUG 12700]